MKITGVYAVAPSVLRPCEEFSLRFKILTPVHPAGSGCWTKVPALKSPFNLSPRGIRYLDNVFEGNIGEIELELEGKIIRFSDYKGIFFDDRRKFGCVEGLSFPSEGVKLIKIRNPDFREAVSNVILVKENCRERIFWGDIHCQTFFSDGLRCVEQLYSFARDEAFLDFFSLSDHSEWITDRQWDYFCNVANDFHQEGRFVTLIGQEWTDHKTGHRNIYFPDRRGKILRADTDSIEEVYRTAHKFGAIVVPHHSASSSMGVNWELAHDAEVERLVEIYSVWGSSELPAAEGNTRPIRVLGGEKKSQHVIDALNRGYRFGFVGGGDIHDGRPGDELHIYQEQPADYRNLYRQGLTAVFTEKLTRKEVFRALYERRCYATSNIRMFLKFSLNGMSSGSVLRSPGKLYFLITGASETPVFRVLVISDGKIYKTFDVCQHYFNLELEEPFQGEHYFYVKAERMDGELAWASPVWIES